MTGSGEVGFVSDGDINALNAAIQALFIDVNAAVLAAKPASPSLRDSQFATGDLLARWKTWVLEHTGFSSRFADDEFAGFKMDYAARRAEFLKLGGSTTAEDIGPGGNPAESWIDRLTASGETVAKVAIGAAILYGLVVIVPPIVAARRALK